MSERATPETDEWVYAWSLVDINDDDHPDYTQDFARKLERERDEAREDAKAWKANHDNQVVLKATLMDRPDLGDRAARMITLIKERDEARELARELRDALENCREDSVELLGEWDWKRGTISRNDRAIEELEGRISDADSVIDKAKEVLP